MAVALLTASTESLALATPPVTAVPLTMACWFNVTNVTAAHTLMAVADAASIANGRFDMFAHGATSGDPVAAFTSSATASEQVNTSTGYSANTWHHAAGVFTAINSRSAFLDGGGKVTGVVSVTPASIDRMRIGVTADVTPFGYTNGSIAEAAVWDVALTDTEVAILANGYSPLLVRPSGLVFYSPLIRDIDAGKWPEHIVGVALTELGTPTVGVHTRVYYPSAPMIGLAAAAAPPVSTFIPRVIIS